MEQFGVEILRHIGGQWLAVFGIVAWVVYKSEIVQRVLGVKAQERTQLSRDQQRLVNNLSEAIARLDRQILAERAARASQREEDRIECDRRLAEIRDECDREMVRMREDIEILIKGEQRWRHLVGNLAQYVAALQRELRESGVEVPRFGGWEKFIAEGGDPMIGIIVPEE